MTERFTAGARDTATREERENVLVVAVTRARAQTADESLWGRTRGMRTMPRR